MRSICHWTSKIAMILTCRVAAVVACFVWMAGSVQAGWQPPQPPEGFVPIDQVPAQDQLPAAPLLIAAYVFVIGALFVYLLSLARRLRAVQQDIDRLEADIRRGPGS